MVNRTALGLKPFQMRPPMIGPVMAPIPLKNVKIPYHLPSNEIGSKSALIALSVTTESTKNPCRTPEIIIIVIFSE